MSEAVLHNSIWAAVCLFIYLLGTNWPSDSSLHKLSAGGLKWTCSATSGCLQRMLFSLLINSVAFNSLPAKRLQLPRGKAHIHSLFTSSINRSREPLTAPAKLWPSGLDAIKEPSKSTIVFSRDVAEIRCKITSLFKAKQDILKVTSLLQKLILSL